MAMQTHRHAEELMAQADVALARGEPGEAQSLLLAAAQAEAEAFLQAPEERVQTRGILAVSAVSLFRRAKVLEAAERHAHLFLAHEGVPDGARASLQQALYELRAEQIERSKGRTLTPDWFDWRLRGAGIGEGTAPLALIGQKIDQIQRFAIRVVEMMADLPLRMQQPVSDQVRQSMSLVMGEPVAGSFRFALRLSVADEQLTWFEQSKPSLEQVGETFFTVLEAVLADDSEELSAAIPNPDYQQAFVRLVRNLIPDGRDLTEIEVSRRGTDAPAVAVLRPQFRAPLDRRIRAMRPPRIGGQREHVLVDILRGVQLNKRWIVVGTETHEQLCRQAEGSFVLADAVEGLIDQPVRVTGQRRGRGFLFTDISPATSEELQEWQEARERSGHQLRLHEPVVDTLQPDDLRTTAGFVGPGDASVGSGD